MMTRKKFAIAFLAVLLAIALNLDAQQFIPAEAGFAGVGRSSVAWADYDNDGDLDLLLAGDPGTGIHQASVYRNNSGEFSNINAGLTGIYNGALAWGDYDNDGDPDILATGRSSSSSKTYLYRNSNGAFEQVANPFPNIGSDGAVAWGDYDGDGDLDALIAGAFMCKIFRNDSGTFTDIQAVLPPVSNSWADWGDFDNDGDLDLFVMGDLGGILISNFYRNNRGLFEEVIPGIFPLTAGSASWCDYDSDMDLDVLVSGFDEYLEPRTTIFRNDGNMVFVNVYPGLTGAALGTAAWGDYDNDGDPDILLTGQNAGCGTLSCLVFRNNGNDNFTDIDAPLEGAERGSAAWGDYDNDGDLDIVITGINGSGLPRTKLYMNTSGSNMYSAGSAPLVPGGLQASVTGHEVFLSWNRSSDDHTPSTGLTYNLRVGTKAGGNEVFPGNSEFPGGYRLFPQPGNMGCDSTWVLHLPDGNYFCSVQALDHAFTASGYAPEIEFTVLNTSLEPAGENGFKAFPNPVLDKLILTSSEAISWKVFNAAGQLISESETESMCHSLDTRTWLPGGYFIRFSSGIRNSVVRVIKK